MTYAKSRLSEIKVLLPYGNGKGSYHFAFANDYKTFCGKECEGWTAAETSVSNALDSVYLCKRCKTNFLK